ncbi:MAG: hypothetical protein LBL00_08365, partial [Endomicrobium sp.]|nr:hypothetical protein [Endomicrobium sp.]
MHSPCFHILTTSRIFGLHKKLIALFILTVMCINGFSWCAQDIHDRSFTVLATKAVKIVLTVCVSGKANDFMVELTNNIKNYFRQILLETNKVDFQD